MKIIKVIHNTITNTKMILQIIINDEQCKCRIIDKHHEWIDTYTQDDYMDTTERMCDAICHYLKYIETRLDEQDEKIIIQTDNRYIVRLLNWETIPKSKHQSIYKRVVSSMSEVECCIEQIPLKDFTLLEQFPIL